MYKNNRKSVLCIVSIPNSMICMKNNRKSLNTARILHSPSKLGNKAPPNPGADLETQQEPQAESRGDGEEVGVGEQEDLFTCKKMGLLTYSKARGFVLI